jgi:predicted RNA binding protein YcfA (HicA-like mRNA interferase family)
MTGEERPPIAWLRNVPLCRIIRALERDGFEFTERQGSQRVYRNPDRRRVVIHYHRPNRPLPPFVIRNLLVGTRWTEEDLRYMLAEAYLELGELDCAWAMAQEAREMSQKAGAQLDLAEATFMLGKLTALKGDKEAAARCLRDATTRFEELGHTGRAADVRLRLNALAGQIVLQRSGSDTVA